MRYFFFGSLMDAEVLGIVLGRAVMSEEMRPAKLSDYRVVGVRNESYPALCAERGASASGVVVEGISDRQAQRLQYFEADEYAPEICKVELSGGDCVPARVFLATESLAHTTDDWSFADFQADGRAVFVDATRQWMASIRTPGMGMSPSDTVQANRVQSANPGMSARKRGWRVALEP